MFHTSVSAKDMKKWPNILSKNFIRYT